MIGSNLSTTDKQTNKIEGTVDQRTIVNKLFTDLVSVFAFLHQSLNYFSASSMRLTFMARF